ncbi:uncharacterized protein EV154DRAFT_534528 [Mucor mucedo]|uniref:uncharacterized protein n=1 Tax=Mucor mucedo TaxID=29922 RepID=UPI002220A95B|nr:uncharacterized protein EV154DRAFT_534528 [Mucor mucedo]KAI7863866.1 hypothetical protein EV154DRAFT_534528 [Mucor mucedo]
MCIFIGTSITFQRIIFVFLVILISSSQSIPLFPCILHPYPQSMLYVSYSFALSCYASHVILDLVFTFCFSFRRFAVF